MWTNSGRRSPKLIDFARWLTLENGVSCEDCRKVFEVETANLKWDIAVKNNKKWGIEKEFKVIEPPCEDCEAFKTKKTKPELMVGNFAAIFIYNFCKDQVIPCGMNGTPVAINHMPIWEAIDRYSDRLGIEDDCETFEKILIVYRTVIGEKASGSIRDSGSSVKSKNR